MEERMPSNSPEQEKKGSELDLAERVGFEPTVPLTVHKLSKPAP